MRRRRAAAATDDIDEAIPGEVLDQPGGRLGRFVVAGITHWIGQARVRIAWDEGVRDARDFLDVRTH